jgi:methylase of polypeptide subunit release factors
MSGDPEYRAHQEWIGYVQPVGLVVSPPALVAAQARVRQNIVPDHRRFLEWIEDVEDPATGQTVHAVANLPGLVRGVFSWDKQDLVGGPGADPLPDDLEVALPEYGETLRPAYAVREPEPRPGGSPWLLLIQVLPLGIDLDVAVASHDRGWVATPQARFERLLRETRVPIGLLSSGTQLRLVYAPRGESAGSMTFPVQAMAEVAGRPIFAGFHMLLEAPRLFTLPAHQRLPEILAKSRLYQSLVSTQLAQQVLSALYEFLRGFQAADEHRRGALLRDVLREDPNHLYAGLLTVLLRLVFVLYAEDRGLLPRDALYGNHYSVSGLYERLRADAGRYPDTMDQRYGAWARLLALFRLIHDGAAHGNLRLPPRYGHLFSPDRYNFLEGRPWRVGRVMVDRIDPPLVSDGVIYRVLQNLIILNGERLSYRTLDVEEIGSVYQTMMGFTLEVARGRSIAVKATKPHGAPTTINLEELLKVEPERRVRWLREQTDQAVTGQALEALLNARTPEDAVATLDKKVAREATPQIVPAGAMVLQPSDERRRSGSHYTPRSLTEPIVEAALRPILEQLGEDPRPEQILDLKVCDPAMGSGAFLVEACRQLGGRLVKAWHAHRCLPAIPPDEDEVLHAQRLVAQRCLYGVDRNPLAADLAKLSLWLATLAKDHAFTFLDHALRHGDSLIGLSRQQIASVHWAPAKQLATVTTLVTERIERAIELRRQIQVAAEGTPDVHLRAWLRDANEALRDARMIGDLVVAAFLGAEKVKAREQARKEVAGEVEAWLDRRTGVEAIRRTAAQLEELDPPVPPFHWELEFPEVFARATSGFDVIIGNPPFMGGRRISEHLGEGYATLLRQLHEDASGGADLVAHFFRRAFMLLRPGGTFGLLATKTIRQGDTRETGLRWTCTNGATIYRAVRRFKWPGEAAVVVSVVHVAKGPMAPPFDLDGRPVSMITAYLFHDGGHESPPVLSANHRKAFIGSYVLGMGFTFADTDTKGVASPVAEMQRLLAKDLRNTERIKPYIGGEEVNDSPTHAHSRYVIDFDEMTESECRRWPDLFRLLEERVKPERMTKNVKKYPRMVNEWWKFWNPRVELYEAIRGLDRVLAIARVGDTGAFTFLPTGMIYSEQLVVIAARSYGTFCTVQSRIHEVWARSFASSMKDDLRYTPSDCFETFPFPDEAESDRRLEAAGRAYFEFRAALMMRKDEGLTKTYNRFNDPEESSKDIVRLRELHAAMDSAVLDAYGWTDIQPTCEFLLDYEEPEEDEEANGKSGKKPWRYRWPDDVHDEVLARLLALNRQRAEAERLTIASVGATTTKASRPRRGRTKVDRESSQGSFLTG